MVFQTEKSGRFAVDTTENYKNAGSCHLGGDAIITIKEHQKIEDLINAHARPWVKMQYVVKRHTSSTSVRSTKRCITQLNQPYVDKV